ncbi:MAG TPA: hypothetical protein VFL51_09060 [Pseudolabrys sp.]|nr:hypothetical protein [Pseudolabrys sp.]
MASPNPGGHEPQIDPALLEDRPGDRASTLQIWITGIAVVVILGIFFFGLSNQRNETSNASGQQMAATQVAPAGQTTPQQGESGKSTPPPAAQKQTNQKSGNQNTQPSTQGGGGGLQQANQPQHPNQPTKASQQENKAQQIINQNAAQAPGGSATTGQGPANQNGGNQASPPAGKQPQQNGTAQSPQQTGQ